jgi:hypothetical protein
MAIPVTIVVSESIFSTGGRIICPHHSRFALKIVEGLMCMHAWSRADMLGKIPYFLLIQYADFVLVVSYFISKPLILLDYPIF